MAVIGLSMPHEQTVGNVLGSDKYQILKLRMNYRPWFMPMICKDLQQTFYGRSRKFLSSALVIGNQAPHVIATIHSCSTMDHAITQLELATVISATRGRI